MSDFLIGFDALSSDVHVFAVIAVVVMAYMFPWCAAIARGHRSTVLVFVVNLLFGWTVVGWFGCMAWSLKSQSEVRP